MRKIFCILFLLFFCYTGAFAAEDLKIITREEWWADENYRFRDSYEWKLIFKQKEIDALKRQNIVYDESQLLEFKERQAKLSKMDKILLEEYWKYVEIESTEYDESGRKYAWPIQKSKEINWIVIHHTVSEYTNSMEWIKQIYKFHALSREWWDIWYNYLIWNDGEIYEWRAGWDKVVAAHDKWNNRSTIGIAVIWNYHSKEININQYNALKALTKQLIEKHDINLNEKTYFHKECLDASCSKPLETELRTPIIWHRDAWHTSCPWDKLAKQIETMTEELLRDPISVAYVYKQKIYDSLSKFSDDKLIWIMAKIEEELEKNKSSNKLKLKWFIIDYFKYKNELTYNSITSTNDDNTIKIKLSYPDSDKIKIKSWTAEFDIKRVWTDISVKWIKFNILKIPKKREDDILEITSWDRVPTWDTEGKYNDNKFRGDIYLYVKDEKIVVVNSLEIEDYLKWLWEISDFEDPEKVKTIITAARSYATWYTTKARKFPGEFYDWSDDPNVFQKYLWYSLELRSPNVNRIVDDTKWQLITYNWKLIKPWYFSNSDGNTMSFYEYCLVRQSEEICSSEAEKYPYLQKVVDKWSEWQKKSWHWVWISWAWVSYYAEKWWTYDMIIKYFLKWVNIS